MNFLQEKEQIDKIRCIFLKHSNNQRFINNKRIRKFFSDLGLASDLFMHDLYLHIPQLAQGADLSLQNCLTFLDYILFENGCDKERIQIFKILDKNGNGFINTNQLLSLLKRSLEPWEYQQYSLIISSYGPLINYLEHFLKKKH